MMSFYSCRVLALVLFCLTPVFLAADIPLANQEPALNVRNWFLVYEEGGTKLYYDSNNLTRDRNGVVTGWAKIAFPATSGGSSTESIFHQEWDCIGRRFRIINDGNRTDWEAISDGSINETLLKSVCSFEPARSVDPKKLEDDKHAWTLVFRDEKSGTTLYYAPKDVIRQKNGIFSVWAKIVFSEMKEGSPDYVVLHEEWNCAEKKFRVVYQGVNHGSKYQSINKRTKWKTVVPNTPNYYFHERVCSAPVGTDDQANQGWEHLMTFKDGKQLYYSPARSIKDSASGFIRAWFKTILPETSKDVYEVILLDEFHCEEGRIRDVQTTVYYRDGKSQTQNLVGEWKVPSPYTMAEIMIAAVCSPPMEQ